MAEEELDAGIITFIVIISMIIIYSVVTNFGIIVVVMRKAHMRTVTNILLANLAMSDILLAGVVLPQHVHDTTHAHDFFEPAIQCKMVNFLPTCCITSSIYTLLVMAVHRYRTIVKQLTTTYTAASAYKAVVGIWVASILLSTPLLFEYQKVVVTDGNETMAECSADNVPYDLFLTYGLVLLLFIYIIPQLVIYIQYFLLAHFVFKKSQVQSQNGPQNSQVAKNRSNITKMLVLCAVLFSISWLPYFCLFTVERVTRKADSTEGDSMTRLLQICFATFSTCYNGLLYLKFNKQFREECKSILGLKTSQVTPYTTSNEAGPSTKTNARENQPENTGSVNTRLKKLGEQI